MALEDGHDESQRLVLGEDDRRQPHAPTEPVAAVAAAGGLDGHSGFSQDRDVPPRRAACDAEAVSDLVRSRARLQLQDLQCLQRAGRRTDLRCHDIESRRNLRILGSRSSCYASTVRRRSRYAPWKEQLTTWNSS